MLPLFSRFYGIHPWHLDRMSVREVSEYLTRLQQLDAQGGDPWQVAPGG